MFVGPIPGDFGATRDASAGDICLEAIILSGVQGAGKSTFCRQRYWNSHVRINYDMLRTRHREAILLAACLEARQPFVVDATNPTAENRARYLLPCRQAGFRIIGIEFRIDPALALARNALREGKARVPDRAIWVTARKFEPLSMAEGFDEIWWAIATAAGVELVRLPEPPTACGHDPDAEQQVGDGVAGDG